MSSRDAEAAAPTQPAGVDAGSGRFASISEVESELARSVELTRKILDNVGDGIYGLDREGRIEFVNAAAARLTGYRVQELLGRNAHATLHSRYPDGSPYPVEQCLTFRALQTGRASIAHDEMFWRKDGSPLPVNVVAVPTLDDDGEVAGLVLSFRDTTAVRAALEQARQLDEAKAREEVQRELADRLQQALLTPPAQSGDLHVVVRYRPAAAHAQVGGDWYDALLRPDGAMVLVVGDVVGHDGVAAARMGQLRGVLRTLAYGNDADTPAELLTRLEHVARGLAVDSLATVVLGRVETLPDSCARVLTWSNAGHPPPILLLADGTSTILERDPDLLLGVDPDSPRRDHRVSLPADSTLLLFTDGLVERRGEHLHDGLQALRGAIADLGTCDLDELCDLLLHRMAPHAGDDDIALVAVRGRAVGQSR